MPVKPARSLSFYMAIFALALVLPGLLFTALVVERWVGAERARLSAQVDEANTDVLEQLDRYLASQVATLQALATSPALDTGDFARFDRQARELGSSSVVVLRDLTGQELVNTRVPTGTPLRAQLRDVDRIVIETGRPAVSDLYAGVVNTDLHVAVAVPVMRGGAPRFILSVSLDPLEISGLLASQVKAPYYAAAVDRTGRIIGRSVPDPTVVGRPLPGFSEMGAGTGRWSGQNVQGLMVEGAYKRSAISGWIVGASIEQAALRAPLLRPLLEVGIASLVLTLIAVGGSVLIVRRVAGAQRQLSEEVRALGAGERVAAPRTRVHEANLVGAALANASERIASQAEALTAANEELEARVAARTRELAAKESLLAATLDSMDQGLIQFDTGCRVRIANRRAVELIGLDRAMLASAPTLAEMFDDLARRGEVGEIDDAMRALSLSPGTKIYERTRPDGTVLEVRTVPLPEGGAVRTYTDITARDAAKRQTEAARVAAEAASAAKSDFLAAMSHEIRTPLNGVIGYADLLAEDVRLDHEQRRHVERIQNAGAALLTVVNDILDFSKIEAGEIRLDPRPFSLARLVDNTVSIVKSSAMAKTLALDVGIADGLPDGLVGDEDRLRQIVLNLLGNAIKFTERGRVALRIDAVPSLDRDGASGLRLSVSDTGIGIPQDKRGSLFQRFSQVDSSIQRKFGGTGLGLAISRRLVELMDGTIGLESREGEGSTFWIELALPRAAVVGSAAATAPLEDGPRTRTGARILLVDDVRINQELARAVLEVDGHVVDVAGDGEEAVHAVERGAYDLVLMDVQMPGMDGLTATRRIRALDDPRRRAVPVIAMTANVLPQQIAACRLAGMDDHIGKPFRRAEVRKVVTAWLPSPSPPDARGAPSATRSDSIVDEEAFVAVETLMGEGTTRELLGYLAEDLRAQFTDLVEPVDRETLIRSAHAMVSSAGLLGFVGLAKACRALEEAGLANGDVHDALARLRRTGAAVLEEIDARRAA